MFSISCNQLDTYGCKDANACNFNPNANIDDDSCIFFDCNGECGGSAIDQDGDNICDDIDDCVGQYDECGVCNGQGIDNGYCQNDLDVLQSIIDQHEHLSGQNPNQLGAQEWENGRLIFLDLHSHLISILTESIGNLSELKTLSLYNNQLSHIPESIGNLVNLTYFNVLSNNLTGRIPGSIGNLTELTYLNLGFNAFSQSIPDSIGNLTQLTEFYITYNQITGDIPESIGNLTELTMISLYGNLISGEIPESIGNLVNLISFNAGINQLEGEIPESIGNLVNLERLWLNYNNLSGEVPDSICNLTLLNWAPDGFEGEESYLFYNSLCPPYPDCMIDLVGEQDTSECPELILGDVNNDLEVNILDVVQIATLILSNEFEYLADLNQDGVVNVLDITLTVNIILD